MESAIRQAGVQTLVTSRKFLELANVELPAGVVPLWIEEIAATIGWTSRGVALLMGLLMPARWIERLLSGRRISVDEVVTVIFSSGSTGEPKGVQLTHFNIDSNVEAVTQVLRVTDDDRLLGILPHFHSFGYMTLWF